MTSGLYLIKVAIVKKQKKVWGKALWIKWPEAWSSDLQNLHKTKCSHEHLWFQSSFRERGQQRQQSSQLPQNSGWQTDCLKQGRGELRLEVALWPLCAGHGMCMLAHTHTQEHTQECTHIHTPSCTMSYKSSTFWILIMMLLHTDIFFTFNSRDLYKFLCLIVYLSSIS